MKVAVYDRYWSTGGGGERFAAGIAAALAGEYQVTLLGPEAIDMGWLAERLQLDLTGVSAATVDEDRAGSVARASADYDLFVNASYQSVSVNHARRGLYVVHFPGPPPAGLQRMLDRWVRRPVARLRGEGSARADLTGGFYSPSPARAHVLNWTGGEAEVTVQSPAGGVVPVTIFLGRYVPAAVAPVEVTAEVDGHVVARAAVSPSRGRWDRRRTVPLRFTVAVQPDRPVRVMLRSPAWVPAEVGVGSDVRRLGVPVVATSAGSGGWHWAARVAPVLFARSASPSFAGSYDRILANSRYTQGWIERMWGCESDVLYPPVLEVPRRPKRPIILSVGRFFTPGAGHNKKQLEMVQAFRRLYERGAAEGWEYHLVGGCAPEHRDYLDLVRSQASGLPVVFHPDAKGADLLDLYGEASVFWHAAGLGEDPERHPDRFEHFGITTVEAMSAGAVPVVIDAAGQVEIVEHGVSGQRFRGVDDLVTLTETLIGDPAGRQAMSIAAEARAKDFGWESFVVRVRHEVDRLMGDTAG